MKLNDFVLETKATVNFSASKNERLAYNDKLVLLDSLSWFSEPIFFWKKTINGIPTVFGRTIYPIKEIEILALQTSDITPLLQLSTAQYTFTDNVIKLDVSFASSYPDGNMPTLSGTIRYSHNPHYIITELKREFMEQYSPDWQNLNGEDKLKRLPVSCIGTKMHDAIPNYKLGLNSGLLTNTFTIPTC